MPPSLEPANILIMFGIWLKFQNDAVVHKRDHSQNQKGRGLAGMERGQYRPPGYWPISIPSGLI
jgi:hypothetical protein